MLGMGTIVVKKSQIEPFKIFIGNPAKYLKSNSVAIERNNFNSEDILRFQELYNDFLKNK